MPLAFQSLGVRLCFNYGSAGVAKEHSHRTCGDNEDKGTGGDNQDKDRQIGAVMANPQRANPWIYSYYRYIYINASTFGSNYIISMNFGSARSIIIPFLSKFGTLSAATPTPLCNPLFNPSFPFFPPPFLIHPIKPESGGGALRHSFLSIHSPSPHHGESFACKSFSGMSKGSKGKKGIAKVSSLITCLKWKIEQLPLFLLSRF